MSDPFRAMATPRAPIQRLTRAALYAFGATSIALTGCESRAIPSYGAPAIPFDASDANSGDDAGDFSHDAGPIVDAADSGPALDAGNDAADAEPIVDAADDGPLVDAGTD